MISFADMVGSRPPRLHTLITSTPVLQSCESEFGVTLATGVSQWNDLSGNGRHYAQGTAALQPSYSNRFAGYPVLTFDGTDDFLVASGLTRPAPATTPTWIWGVIRVETGVASARVLGVNATNVNACLLATNIDGSVNTFGGTAGNACATLGFSTWARFEAYFSGSTADFLRYGPNTASGTNSGNTGSAVARVIGKSGTNPTARISLACLMYAAALPNAAERAALDGWASGKYRGLVSV